MGVAQSYSDHIFEFLQSVKDRKRSSSPTKTSTYPRRLAVRTFGHVFENHQPEESWSRAEGSILFL